MYDKFKIFETIDSISNISDINNIFITKGIEDRYEVLCEINKKLKENNLIGEYESIYFHWGIDRELEYVSIQQETRTSMMQKPEKFITYDGTELSITRREHDNIELDFKFDKQEWLNYKRTILIDKIIN